MSFDPLPTRLVEDLARTAGAPAVEPGCGDGRLTRRLRSIHPWVVGLDRLGPLTRPGVIADAGAPPLHPGSAGAVIMGNTYRHLDDGPAALARWREAMRGDGCLWILEDEPAGDGRPGALYRDLQRLLDDLVPLRRGTLLPLAAFRHSLSSERGWSFGLERNRETPADLAALIAGLEFHGGTVPAAARMAAALRVEGLDYGHYWWARWSSEESL